MFNNKVAVSPSAAMNCSPARLLPEPYYTDGQITIFNADNRAILPLLPSSSVDLVITSPPYNMGNTTGGGRKQYKPHYNSAGGMKVRGGSSKWKGAALAEGYGNCDDNLPHEKYVALQKAMLRECWRLISDDGAIFYNHKQRILNGEAITPFAYNPDLPIRQVITWARSGGINFNTRFYMPTDEWIVIFAKPDFKLRDKGASGVGSVWYMPQETNTPHPAPFPLQLPKQIISTTDAQTVLDPFMGSGTTLRAAKDMNIKAIGIEIEERYCEIAAKRLQQQTLGF